MFFFLLNQLYMFFYAYIYLFNNGFSLSHARNVCLNHIFP